MLKISAVIMAAGKSRRMGENKLLMELGGQSIVSRLITSLPAGVFHKIVLVYSDEAVRAEAEKHNLSVIKNSRTDSPKHVTIKLGTEFCSDSDGIMFFAADQPFLMPDTVRRLIKEFADFPKNIIIPLCKGKNRNPVIFTKSAYPELQNLNDDIGGRTVIQNFKDGIRFVEFDNEMQFMDIDTREDYEKAKSFF
jgi:molybdenum cofactor cytidylyltransferase